MSYDVDLIDPDTLEVLPFSEQFEEGGTYAIGGVAECSLNITYNYAEVFGPLVRNLDGKTATETLPALTEFCQVWEGREPYERDYWAPTPGNALKAIARLVTFATAHPNGVWRVS